MTDLPAGPQHGGSLFPGFQARCRSIMLRLSGAMDRYAEKNGALNLLFWVAFVESSVFPLSVDAFLITLGVAAPKRSLRMAAVTALGSVAGGYLGYFIGYSLFDALGRSIVHLPAMGDAFLRILRLYHRYGATTIVLAGFIPLPYLLFTLAAGFNKTLDVWTLTLGALIGRSLRFGIVGLLLYYWGPKARVVLGRYAAFASIVLVLSVVIVFIVMQWLT